MTEYRDVFSQQLVQIIKSHYRLIIVAPLFAAMVGYLFASFITPLYSSQAFIRINPAMARDYRTMWGSPNLAIAIAGDEPDAGDTPEAKARFLNKHLFIKDQEPLTDKMAVRLYKLESYHSDPQVASDILNRAIGSLNLQASTSASPNMPTEPSWPSRRGFAFLAFALSLPLTFVVLVWVDYARRRSHAG